MNFHEFSSQPAYVASLIEENKLTETEVHTSEFLDLFPLILRQYEGAYIRDYLHIDGTFAVIFPKRETWSLREAINLYETLCTVLSTTLYTEVSSTGFIELDNFGTEYEGFWVSMA